MLSRHHTTKVVEFLPWDLRLGGQRLQHHTYILVIVLIHEHLGRNLLGVEHWAAMGMLLVDCGIFSLFISSTWQL